MFLHRGYSTVLLSSWKSGFLAVPRAIKLRQAKRQGHRWVMILLFLSHHRLIRATMGAFLSRALKIKNPTVTLQCGGDIILLPKYIGNHMNRIVSKLGSWARMLLLLLLLCIGMLCYSYAICYML